jgi:hypothetical protein
MRTFRVVLDPTSPTSIAVLATATLAAATTEA